MSRLVSFWILLGIVFLLAILFFRVIGIFLVPLFLAAVLVVIFNPLHHWILGRVQGKRRIAAGLTMLAIMSLVLIPIGLLITFAILEGIGLVKSIRPDAIVTKLEKARAELGLEIPEIEHLRLLEDQLQTLSRSVAEESSSHAEISTEYLRIDLQQLGRMTEELSDKLALGDPAAGDPTEGGASDDAAPGIHDNAAAAWPRLVESLESTKEFFQQPQVLRAEAQSQVNRLREDYQSFRTQLLGGSVRASLADLANPTREQLKGYAHNLTGTLQSQVLNVGEATLGFVVKAIVGIVILLLSIYFFLLDGPAMLGTLKTLSPLDDRYEDELIQEFDRVSRALVLATLLAVFVQGSLAGIGYYFAGLQSVFLLTLLTMMFAMVPVVGTSVVWVPASIYIYVVEERLVAAIVLGLYCLIVVSQIDNLIKPLVLHGQSKIHPLLALLSILGGVATLGPIGVLIGPMVVAFMQTLLSILQREISQLDEERHPATASPSP